MSFDELMCSVEVGDVFGVGRREQGGVDGGELLLQGVLESGAPPGPPARIRDIGVEIVDVR